MKKHSSYNLKYSKSNHNHKKGANISISNTALPINFLNSDYSQKFLSSPLILKSPAGEFHRRKILSTKKKYKEESCKQNIASNFNQKPQVVRKDMQKQKAPALKQFGLKKQINKIFRKTSIHNIHYEHNPKGTSNSFEMNLQQKQMRRQKQIKIFKENEKEKQKKINQKKKSFISKNNLMIEERKSQQCLKCLDTYITKCQQVTLIQYTSDSNLRETVKNSKNSNLYYISNIVSAYQSEQTSKFQEICKKHLISSIEFLSYAANIKQWIPKNCKNIVHLSPTSRKTIIFDLDETLIHSNSSIHMPHDVVLEITPRIKAAINIRPFAKECLRSLSKVFEIIVFTASHESYANAIIDHLDPEKKYISYRLFRQHCYKTPEGFCVKDLRILNRDLENVLLLDNAAYSYCFQPHNGVPIVPFYDNKADTELKQVTAYLKKMAKSQSMRLSNANIMRLSQYPRYHNPQNLINQLYS